MCSAQAVKICPDNVQTETVKWFEVFSTAERKEHVNYQVVSYRASMLPNLGDITISLL